MSNTPRRKRSGGGPGSAQTRSIGRAIVRAGIRGLSAGVGFKWIGVAGLVLVAVVLHQIPYPVDVTLHVTTERVNFSLIGPDETVLRGLSLTSLALLETTQLRLALEDVRELGRTLVRAGEEATLDADQRGARLVVRSANGLRLERLTLAPGTQLEIYADRVGQVFVVVRRGRASQIQLGLFGRVSLEATGMRLVRGNGQAIEFATPGPAHELDAKPASRSPILEPVGDRQFTLVLGFGGRAEQAGQDGLRLPFSSQLKITSLDFTRQEKVGERSAVRHLWIDPVVPMERALRSVYLDVPGNEVFRLESVQVVGDGLVCDIAGRPSALKVGKAGPGQDLVPSMLKYSLDHIVVRMLCKPIGFC